LQREYLEFLVTLIPAPLFYVPGNHDKHFIAEPPGGCIPLDGRVELYKGLRIAGLGGCKSGHPVAAYEYSEPVMEKRAVRLRKAIKKYHGLDILLTHAPPLGLGDGAGFHEGFGCFLPLLDRFKPKVHVFGHLHKRYGFAKTPEYYGKTRLVNACGYVLLEV